MKSIDDTKGFVKVGLWLAALATSAYLLMLGWYNTLSLDDYMYLFDIEQLGQLGYVRKIYFTWQGRFSVFFVSSYLMPLFGNMANMLPYTVFQMLIGTLVIFLFLKWGLELQDRLLLFVCAMLINNVAVLALLEFSTYYWLCCMCYFLVPYATILLVGLLFFKKDRRWYEWGLALLCALFISGSAENFTPMVIIVLGIYFLWMVIIKKHYRFWQNEQELMLFICLLIMVVGFFFMLFAPGNKVRLGDKGLNNMKNFVFVIFMKKSIKATVILIIRMISRSLWYLVIFPVFVWLGCCMRRQGINLKMAVSLKHFILSMLALGLFVFIAVAGCVYGLGWYAPNRANSYMSYVLMAFYGYWGVALGNVVIRCDKMVSMWMVCSCLILLVVMIVYFVNTQPEVKSYHAQIEARDAMIENEVKAGRRAPLVIEPLVVHQKYNSYYLLRKRISNCFGKSYNKENELWYPYMPSVLNEKPSDFKNNGLRNYYHAQFDIIGWTKD